MQQKTDYIHHYNYRCLLGRGGQADVYLVDDGKQLLAAKVYKVNQCVRAKGESQQEFNERVGEIEACYATEVDILELINRADSKYVIKCLGSEDQAKVKIHDREEFIEPVIFLEFAEEGCLFDYIYRTNDSIKRNFSEATCKSLLMMLIQGVKGIHQHRLVHFDIKPGNLLFDKNFRLKIADFGLSEPGFTESKEVRNFKQKKGTAGYQCPQMLKAIKAAVKMAHLSAAKILEFSGFVADVFAIGVFFFLIFTGNRPFYNADEKDPYYLHFLNNSPQKFWGEHEKNGVKYSKQFKELINSFLAIDKAKRPTFQSLKNNLWLKKDNATMQQLTIQLKKRKQILTLNNPRIKKIQQKQHQFHKQITHKLYLQKLNQENRPFYGSANGISVHKNSNHGHKIKETQPIFAKFQHHEVRVCHINLEDLPYSDLYGLIWVRIRPTMLFAMLEKYIIREFKEKNVFQRNPIMPIRPETYICTYNHSHNTITLHLQFKTQISQPQNDKIHEKNFERSQVIKIQGQLMRDKEGRVAVSWGKREGNVYWVAEVMAEVGRWMGVLALGEWQ